PPPRPPAIAPAAAPQPPHSSIFQPLVKAMMIPRAPKQNAPTPAASSRSPMREIGFRPALILAGFLEVAYRRFRPNPFIFIAILARWLPPTQLFDQLF